MSPEEEFLSPTDNDIEHIADSAERRVFDEIYKKVERFVLAWNEYSKIIRSSRGGEFSSQLVFFKPANWNSFLEHKEQLEKDIKELTENEVFSKIGIKIEDTPTGIYVSVDNNRFKEWLHDVRRFKGLKSEDASVVISITEILLKQVYRTYPFDTTEYNLGFFVSIPSLIEIAEYIPQKTEAEFFKQDVQNLKYIKEAIEHKALNEYIQMVRIGLIDSNIYPELNFPWTELSPKEFSEKYDVLDKGLASIVSIQNRMTSADPRWSFVSRVLKDFKTKLNGYTDIDNPNRKILGITREHAFRELSLLLQNII